MLREQPFLIGGDTWLHVWDGNPTAAALYDRHYSRNPKAKGDPRIAGPGEKIVLLTPCARGLFVWRKFISKDGQQGVNCAIFRNEGAGRASDLIRAAMVVAWSRWPGQRLYTYVNPRRVRSANPGYCFKRAGWRLCGVTKTRKLLILEAFPMEEDDDHDDTCPECNGDGRDKWNDYLLPCPACHPEPADGVGATLPPLGWLYDWTHSSALGKPDEHFTGFTTDEAYARKHDNVRPVWTHPGMDARAIIRTTWEFAGASRWIDEETITAILAAARGVSVGQPAHSKSEYKRRVAMGDPNVAPPPGVAPTGGNDGR